MYDAMTFLMQIAFGIVFLRVLDREVRLEVRTPIAIMFACQIATAIILGGMLKPD